MYDKFVSFVQNLYQTEGIIPLHEPRFCGREKKLLADCIDSTFVSSVGKYVDQFENEIKKFTGSLNAVAVVNGTQALFIALKLSGAQENTEVITQSLTFVATANAITYTGAVPIFIDVDQGTMGLSPKALRAFLHENSYKKDGTCWNKFTDKQIVACVPMHTLGHPCEIKEIKQICDEYSLNLVEDAAESLGSYYQKEHTGTFGKLGIFSFNGNKIITTGGGGAIITDDDELAKRAKHLTTTAKISHPWEFNHDEIGYNFRLPNLNAALGIAQMEQLPSFLKKKRALAEKYGAFFKAENLNFVREPEKSLSNYWLNSILMENKQHRDAFLQYTNSNKVMTRGFWTPMHMLPMFKDYQRDDLVNTDFLFDRFVCLPSSVQMALV
jgi:perosamine synthetase